MPLPSYVSFFLKLLGDPMSDDTQSRRLGTIDASRLVLPIGFFGAIAVALFGAKSWLDSQFGSLHDEIRNLQFDMKVIQTQSGNRWTGTDMELWAEKLARQNPNLQVPSTKWEKP